MKRIYHELIRLHLSKLRQMAFLMGPRQVGKTTLSLDLAGGYARSAYVNWDNPTERLLILEGVEAVARHVGLEELSTEKPLLILDEIHKYGKWKQFLKGFFDAWERRVRIVVTGSARLNIYKRGGDSLMGRYFYYRIHPLSVAEIATTEIPEGDIRQEPHPISDADWQALLQHGGFPEPFTQRSPEFSRRLSDLRREQLFREDIRDGTRIQALAQLELLAELLKHQAAQAMDYQSLAKKVGVSPDTVRRWIEVLKAFYYCFALTPWSKNIHRSLIKEPKLYLWDWSLIQEEGHRQENLVANHLLKAVDFWNDRGIGAYQLHYLRTKDQVEVDFCVTRNGQAWFLVEVKTKAKGISSALYRFKEQTGALHAFQVAFDLPYVHKNCFEEPGPLLVPARTFLSQLI
jgi:hypothetical protein